MPYRLLIMITCLSMTLGCAKKQDTDTKANNAKTHTQETKNNAKDDHAKKDHDKADDTKTGDKVEDVLSTAQALVANKKPLTPKQYEALLLDLKNCTVKPTGYSIDYKCESYKTFNKAKLNKTDVLKDLAGMRSSLGKKYITHQSTAVRIRAIGMMGSLFGANNKSQELLLNHIKTEKNPSVLMKITRTIGSKSGKNPAVAKMLIDLSKHEDENVRREAGIELVSYWAKGSEGTLERAIQMVETDKSIKVREVVCSGLGSRADERALPTLKKYTESHEKHKTLYSKCMKGLLGMWLSAAPHKSPSKKAYELTLKRLSVKKRDKHTPPWTSVSTLQWAKLDKFKQNATWYKNDKVLKLVTNLISDKNWNWIGRTSAVKTYVELGGTKKGLEAILKKSYKGVDPAKHDKTSSNFVVKELHKQIAKMK